MSLTSSAILQSIYDSIGEALKKTDLTNEARSELINQYEQTAELIVKKYNFLDVDLESLPTKIQEDTKILLDGEIQTLQNWKTKFLSDKEYLNDTHVGDNMIENPLFILNGEKSLNGWHSVGDGITMEVMHPFTRGFSTPYVPSKTASHVDDKVIATETNPYWAGAYKAFGGSINFGDASNGGLISGWDYVNGNILKITYDGSTTHTSQFYFNILNQYFGMSKKVNFSAFVFVEEGVLFMGDHAGYKGIQNSSLELTAKQDWEYVNLTITGNDAGSGNTHYTNCFGFNKDIPSIVYIAIPNLVLMNKGDGKIISMKRT